MIDQRGAGKDLRRNSSWESKIDDNKDKGTWFLFAHQLVQVLKKRLIVALGAMG